MKVSMDTILRHRRLGLEDRLNSGGTVKPVQTNPFRQFCKSKGITGKGKKKLRREIRKRELTKASANDALASLEGLIR